MKNKNKSFMMSILAALFAALVCVGAYVAVPLPMTPIPIVLQNMFIMLAALILGPVWGTVSVLLYLILGILGLPVFSGAGKGIAHFMGPTGGFLVSYIFAALIIGVISVGRKPSLGRCYLALFVGMVVIYGLGVTWLKIKLDITWAKAFTIGMLPFLPGDFLKVLIAGVLGWKIKPVLRDLM